MKLLRIPLHFLHTAFAFCAHACLTFCVAVRHSRPMQVVGLDLANHPAQRVAVAPIENNRVPVKAKRLGARASAALVLALCGSIASSQVRFLADAVPFDRPGFDRSGLVQVGHDNIVVDPTVRRYTGMVAALGSPNAQGKVYSFKASPVGPRSFALSPDDLRGWRLTVLAGKRFGEVFTVSTNTESEITVTADKGPIDGLDVHDVFIIESVDADGMSMFGPAGGASVAPSPGV